VTGREPAGVLAAADQCLGLPGAGRGVALALGELGSRRIDELTTADVAALVATLAGKGKKRETIRKAVSALAMVLDHAGVTPNPARDKVQVRLPRGDTEEAQPPTAGHVEAVHALRLEFPD
jgi:hypothetical protein